MTMPVEDEVRSAVRWLLSVGWQVRPNPILHKVRAVQLSLIYAVKGELYVDVVTLSFNAPSLLVHCVTSYNPDFPFDHNVVWEEFLPVGDALKYAMDLSEHLHPPTEQKPAEPAHDHQHQGEPAQQAPEWFFQGRDKT